MALVLQVREESWPVKGKFSISRGTRRQADLVVVEISDGERSGRGEAVPYPRYGETVAQTIRAIEQGFDQLKGQCSHDALPSVREALQQIMRPGAARNALDCALWDLEAKQTGATIWELTGVVKPEALTTAYTLSLDSPDAMAQAAVKARRYPLLKLKLGGRDGKDRTRLEAVRQAVPEARLIVDANEAWTADQLPGLLAAAAKAQVELIEQPLPADGDDILREIHPQVPICADESAHTREELAALTEKYQAINIKLDKTGGLSEALAMMSAARKLNFQVMVGCMLATSLAMAPALVVAAQADIVDLDGPLLLAKDRDHGLVYTNGVIDPPEPELWG